MQKAGRDKETRPALPDKENDKIIIPQGKNRDYEN